MLPLTVSQHFRRRLQSPVVPADRHRIEWLLAIGRAVLALCALVAVYLDATEPTLYSRMAYGLLLLYGVHSVIVLVLLGFRREFSSDFPLILQGVDLLFATLLTLFTHGPNSPFYVLFVFVLLAAAYRWGYWETLATAFLAIALLFVEAALLSGEPVEPQVLEGSYELNRFIIRSVYLLLMGFLLGYLAEAQKLLEAETSAIARLMRQIQGERTLRRTIQAVLGELKQIFEPRRVLLVARDADSGSAVLWDAELGFGDEEDTLKFAALEATQARAYLFPTTADSWSLVRAPQPGQGGEGAFDGLALNAEGRRTDERGPLLPAAFLEAYPSRSLLAVSFAVGEEWSGRLFLIDPVVGAEQESELRFLQTLIRQSAPAVYSIYLLRRLRSRIGAIERARVARELHDGAVQSLISIELQLDVLRRHAADETTEIATDLTRIQQLLHREILSLRELMEEMKPLELTAKEFPGYLAEVVEKFRRETGIAARLVCDAKEVSLSSHVCREIVRILQEALVNVRRHSGARNVLVRFAPQNGMWKLVIEDDGRGFDFQGRLNGARLGADRRGPQVIRDRVHSIRGELTIESGPDGAQLEVLIPQREDE